MEQLIMLLETAYKYGINAGIIEAAHTTGLLKEVKEKNFSDFIDDPSVKFLIENLASKIK